MPHVHVQATRVLAAPFAFEKTQDHVVLASSCSAGFSIGFSFSSSLPTCAIASFSLSLLSRADWVPDISMILAFRSFTAAMGAVSEVAAIGAKRTAPRLLHNAQHFTVMQHNDMTPYVDRMY